MKKSLLLFCLTVLTFFSFGQSSNLIVFSENGEHFSVVLNGVLQNAQPETNVMITNLLANSYQAKIVFEQEGIPDLTKTIYFQEANTQATYRLIINKKGEYVLRFFNAIPIAQAPPPAPAQHVLVYTLTPPVTSTTITKTTTITTEGGNPNSDNVNVNVNMEGVNMNINIDANESSSTTYTETIITTTENVPAGNSTGYILPGYNGSYGCPYPMSPSDFENAKNSIASKSFSDSKLRLAKQIIDSNCLLSSQVMQIMQLFDFESDKLELAKYAYGYTLDYGNYYQLNNAFEYESSIEELDNYIQSFKRPRF